MKKRNNLKIVAIFLSIIINTFLIYFISPIYTSNISYKGLFVALILVVAIALAALSIFLMLKTDLHFKIMGSIEILVLFILSSCFLFTIIMRLIALKDNNIVPKTGMFSAIFYVIYYLLLILACLLKNNHSKVIKAKL